MKTVWKREMQSYFHTVTGYVFVGVFWTVASALFYMAILSQRSGDLPTFIGEMSYLWLLLCPILTMRLLAEERQKKTDQLLLTSPVSLPGIVAGKYLAAVTVMLITVTGTLLYALTVALYGKVYPAELAVNYLGFILQGCAFIALDLWIGSFCGTPMTAAILSFGANFLLWILDLLSGSVSSATVTDVIAFLSPYSRNEAFLMGQLSPAGILFDLSVAVIFLALTVHRLDAKRRRHGRLFSLAVLIPILIFLAAVNVTVTVLEKNGGWRRDYSFNGITSQTETTRDVLKELETPVHIWALFSKGEEDAPLMELLDRYAAESPLVSWEKTDPALNPSLLTRFSTAEQTISSDSLIVYSETTGRWKILSPADFVSVSLNTETGEYEYAGYTYEQSVTSAIAWVSAGKIPRIGVVQGHGELDGSTLESFDGLLTENQYEVGYLSLNDDGRIGDYDVLAFFSPMRDLNEAELNAVGDFAKNGGSILFTCDYSDPVAEMDNYLSLLRYFGFVPLEGLTVADPDAPETYYNNIRMDIIPEMCSTDITADLIASGANTVLLPGARAFEKPGDSDRNLILAEVLRSGETAYLKDLKSGATTLDREEGDMTGPFTLAIQARRITENGEISRAFIAGSSTLLTEKQLFSMTDSGSLLLRVVDFLADSRATAVMIPARDALRPALGVGSLSLGSVLLAALPLSVLLAAMIILVPRLRRR